MNTILTGFLSAQDPLRLVMLLAIAFIIGMFAALLWGMSDQIRERVRCPVMFRMARVTFRLAEDGTKSEVVRCSLLRGRRTIICGKVCVPATPR